MNLSFLTQFWPNFNFVDFQAYFGNFSLIKNAKNKSAIPLMIRIRIRALSKTIFFWVKLFLPWLSYVRSEFISRLGNSLVLGPTLLCTGKYDLSARVLNCKLWYILSESTLLTLYNEWHNQDHIIIPICFI